MKTRRKYGIRRGDFENVYALVYVDDGELPDDFERITRKEAESLARDEVDRRIYDPSYVGHAMDVVLPLWAYKEMRTRGVIPYYDLVGRVAENVGT